MPKKSKTATCKTGNCPLVNKSSQPSNGKGDKTRPFSKKTYDQNYESINWKKR